LLRAADEIGLRELLQEEWRAFETRLAELVAERQHETAGEETISSEKEFHEDLFFQQIPWMKRIVEKGREAPGAWPELAQWAIWCIVQTCGAFAVSRERFAIAAGFFDPVSTRRRSPIAGTLAMMGVPRIGAVLGEAVMKQYSGDNWCAPY
jgi:hypothetical protein